jgi:hypothetical protein
MTDKLYYGDIEYEQQELPLEWPVYDHYTVELRKGAELETVRSMKAESAEDALGFIEGFRDSSETKDHVTWKDREVDGTGSLMGLAPGGVVWQIQVTPDLNTELG